MTHLRLIHIEENPPERTEKPQEPFKAPDQYTGEPLGRFSASGGLCGRNLVVRGSPVVAEGMVLRADMIIQAIRTGHVVHIPAKSLLRFFEQCEELDVGCSFNVECREGVCTLSPSVPVLAEELQAALAPEDKAARKPGTPYFREFERRGRR